MKRRTAVAMVAAAALLVLPACGDDDDDGGEGKALSATEFRTQANAVCKTVADKAARETAALAGKGGDKEPTPEEVRRYLDEQIDAMRRMLDDLGRIPPPGPMKARYTDFVAEGRKVVAGVEGLTGKPEEYVAAATRLGAKFDEAAKSLGLKECTGEVGDEE